MTAPELLDTLHAAGLEVWADGTRVCVSPINRLDPALTRDIADLRAQLLVLLRLPPRSVDEVLDDWRGRGAEVVRCGARCVVRPATMVTREERIILRRRQAALLELVDQDEQLAAECPPCLPGVGPRSLGPRVDCYLCFMDTSIRYGDGYVFISLCQRCAPNLPRARERHLLAVLSSFHAASDPEVRAGDREHFIKSIDDVGPGRAEAVLAHPIYLVLALAKGDAPS